MNQRLIELLREAFAKEMAAKTGWGRNEILAAFERSIGTASAKMLDEMEEAAIFP